MSSQLNGLERWLQPYARDLVAYFPRLTITSVRRSRTDQLALWNNRHNNPYPVAPPGHSKHELGLAWDMVGPADQLALAGRVWESWGGVWGGRFDDPIHFEVRTT